MTLNEIRHYMNEGPSPDAAAVNAARERLMALALAAEPTPFDSDVVRQFSSSRRAWQVGVPAACVTAAAVAVVAFVLPDGAKPIVHSMVGAKPTTSHPATVQARLLDALATDSSDILEDVNTLVVPGTPSCPTTSYSYPYVATAGAPFRMINTVMNSTCTAVQEVNESNISTATIRPIPQLPTGVALSGINLTVEGPGEFTGYDNQTKTWWDSTSIPTTSQPETTTQVPDTFSPAILQQAVAAGEITVVGPATIDGTSAIKLTLGNAAEGDVITLYVDAQSYLPIEMDEHTWDGLESNKQWYDTIDKFTFLPPTAANLANFDVQAPAGYTQTPGQPDPLVPSTRPLVSGIAGA